MISKKMSSFCKSEDCPSSDELLEFQNSEARREKIRTHLASCEFCSAEVDFYSRYPQDEGAAEPVKLTGIPAPLFELAEALLKNRHADASSLNELLSEARTK